MNERQKNLEPLEVMIETARSEDVRALIRDISQKVGIPMCAHAIKRTKIGDFELPK
jgi:tRNA U55 pseudouridine synthase TruB